MNDRECYLEMIEAMEAGDLATARIRATALAARLSGKNVDPAIGNAAAIRFDVEGVLRAEEGRHLPDLYRARRRHYQAVDLQVWWFLSGEVGGSEVRVLRDAESEVWAVIERLGTAAVEPVLHEVHAAFRERIGERSWRAFWQGSDEERAAIREEFLTGTGDWRCQPAGPAEPRRKWS